MLADHSLAGPHTHAYDKQHKKSKQHQFGSAVGEVITEEINWSSRMAPKALYIIFFSYQPL